MLVLGEADIDRLHQRPGERPGCVDSGRSRHRDRAAQVDPKLSFAAIGYDGKSCPSHTYRSQYPSGSAQLMGSCYSFPAIDWSRCAASEHAEGLTSGSAARVSFDDLVGALQKRVRVIERDLALMRR
jgi:hypothetical protein